MNPEWYYTANGGQHGPVTAAELKKLARAGTILPEDLVWKNGTPNWVPAKSVKGLFASTETPAKSESPKPSEPVAGQIDSETELIDDLPAKKKNDNRLSDRLSELQRKPIKDETPEPEEEEDEEVQRPKKKSRRQYDDEDDEDTRPARRKSRRNDDDDEEEEPQSRRRSRRDDDEDEDDRPTRSRRRNRDDDDDDDDDYRPKSRRSRSDRKGLKPGAGLGMTSMICGVTSLVASLGGCVLGAFCFLGLFAVPVSGVLALVAVCLGFPALKTEGKGYGIAGLITGFLGMIPSLLSIIGLIFGVAFGGMNAFLK